MIISLTWRDWLEDVRVVRHPDRDDALRRAASRPEDRTTLVFDTEAPDGWSELRSYSIGSLLQVYNKLLYDGEPRCHKFMRSDDARRMVEDRLVAIARDMSTQEDDVDVRDEPQVEAVTVEFEGEPSVEERAEVEFDGPEPARPEERPKRVRRTNGAGGTKVGHGMASRDPDPERPFRQVKPGTVREAIATRMDGTRTTAQIADEIGHTVVNTQSHIFCLWRDCGVGFRFDDERRVSLVLPEGATSIVKTFEAVSAEAAQ
jgi:hypothetical protein